jgi:hypothetical protein
MKTTRIALLVAAAFAAPAFATIDNYTIDLRRDTSGLDITATAVPGPNASVELSNKSSSRARCYVDFEGGRLTPSRREALLEPGASATVTRLVNDPAIERLNVGLSCTSVSADEPIPAGAPGPSLIRGPGAPGTGLPPAQPVVPRQPGTPQ